MHQRKYRLNPFRACFSRIAAAMATRPAYIEGTSSHARHLSTGSDLSSSSQEDKPEESSKQALSSLIEEVLICDDNGVLPMIGPVKYLLQLAMQRFCPPLY